MISEQDNMRDDKTNGGDNDKKDESADKQKEKEQRRLNETGNLGTPKEGVTGT